MTDPAPAAPPDGNPAPSLSRGFAVVKDALHGMPNRPGCYVMRDGAGEVLYVGKAAALAKRVRNYASPTNLPNRILRMIAETATLSTTVTNSEAEALLLENNLIKSERPKFNILFRDDKSFPYIELSAGHDWPMLSKHRGEKKPENTYYGPFASAGAVESTIVSLQKAFQLRSCSDHIFRTRTRPCAHVETGARTASLCALVHLAYDHGREMRWNPRRERFLNDKGDNGWLDVPHRAPYSMGRA